MTPLTELTALMRDYAERHNIRSGVYIDRLSQDGNGILRICGTDGFLFYFDNETDFLNEIKG